jgi:Ran GTPase-activating protein (RanGAP) involved in mRNA processing and transport
MQILKQLPAHLLEHVIRCSPASLDEKLSALPPSVHHLAILATFPSIITDHSISVDAKQYSASSLAAVFRAITVESSKLHSLRVSSLHLDKDGTVLKSFTAFIICHSSLQQLAITDWDLSPAAVETICIALRRHTAIHTLEITQCDIGEDNIRAIARAVSYLQGLRHLTVRQNKVTTCEKTAAVLTAALAQLPLLTHLDLGNNPMSSCDTATLAQSLFHVSELQHLNLCACYIKQSAQALAPALGTLTQLTALTLANNMLQRAGVEALVPAIASLQNLQCLDLRRNGICTAGVRAMCLVLPGMTALKHLYLGFNSMCSAGVLSPLPWRSPACSKQPFLFDGDNIAQGRRAASCQVHLYLDFSSCLVAFLSSVGLSHG